MLQRRGGWEQRHMRIGHPSHAAVLPDPKPPRIQGGNAEEMQRKYNVQRGISILWYLTTPLHVRPFCIPNYVYKPSPSGAKEYWMKHWTRMDSGMRPR